MKGKNILRLTLNRYWFKMILSGTKTDEYRNIKPYWQIRLTTCYNKTSKRCKLGKCRYCLKRKFKEYTHIEFRNGYSKNVSRMLIECNGISVGKGDFLLGAPLDRCYILKLGEILEKTINGKGKNA